MATPCCPAPVSAITRVLPIRSVSSAWPSVLLILWAAGVVEVFAFQPDLRAAALVRQPLGKVQRRGPADVVPQQPVQGVLKLGIFIRCRVGGGQLVECRD